MFGRATIRLGIGPHSSYYSALDKYMPIACIFLCLLWSPYAIGQTIIMAALRSRCGHYIFALWFLSFYLFLFLA